MSRSLRTSATGMIAQQLNIDNISNNLSNVNTTGFKKSKAEFQDLLYHTIRTAGTSAAQGALVPVEIQIGYGTRVVATQKIFDQAAEEVSREHWIWDGVHPLPQGHELIARNWLQAVSEATNKEA